MRYRLPGRRGLRVSELAFGTMMLAAVGLALTRSRRPERRAFGWIMAAVNGPIPSVYMAVSPLLGLGDWTTVLRRFDAPPAVRGPTAGAAAGLAVVWFFGRGIPS